MFERKVVRLTLLRLHSHRHVIAITLVFNTGALDIFIVTMLLMYRMNCLSKNILLFKTINLEIIL